jgi:hypothetical protein
MPLLEVHSSPSQSAMPPLFIEKMVEKLELGRGTQNTKRHAFHEGDGYACRKIDLLMKKLDDCAAEKEAMEGTVQAMDSHMTCEVCGEVRHSGNNWPKTREEASYINNRFGQDNNNRWNNQNHPQRGNSNFNSNYNSNLPSLKDLILGQAKINENINKKLMFNDKIFENINSKLEILSSSIKNQLSFNKMIETQIAQIVAAILVNHRGKSRGNPRILPNLLMQLQTNEEEVLLTDDKR